MSNIFLSTSQIQNVMLDPFVDAIIRFRAQSWGQPEKKPRKESNFILCPICAMLTRTASISTIRRRAFPAPRLASHHSDLCDICHIAAENEFFELSDGDLTSVQDAWNAAMTQVFRDIEIKAAKLIPEGVDRLTDYTADKNIYAVLKHAFSKDTTPPTLKPPTCIDYPQIQFEIATRAQYLQDTQWNTRGHVCSGCALFTQSITVVNEEAFHYEWHKTPIFCQFCHQKRPRGFIINDYDRLRQARKTVLNGCLMSIRDTAMEDFRKNKEIVNVQLKVSTKVEFTVITRPD